MLFRLPVTLLSAIVCMARANVIPPDPTITAPAVLPRQLDAAWIGWVQTNGTWSTQKCNAGLTWYQSGNYAQCCAETLTACPAATACVRGSQIYPFSGTTITTACTANYNNATYSVCNTAFIFESFGDSNPKTDIICGDQSQVWSYYRQVPASVSEFPSGNTGSSKGHSSGSKAWIAGAVVGPLVGIALIAIVVFLLMRRSKKNKQNNLTQTGAAAMGPPAGTQQTYTDAKPQLTPPAYGQAPAGVDNSYNQQAYTQQTTSPSPQYQQPYGAPASPPPQQQPQQQYGAPVSPGSPQPQQQYAAPTSPHQTAFAAQDASFGYTTHTQHHNAVELGGISTPMGGQHTAELPSGARNT